MTVNHVRDPMKEQNPRLPCRTMIALRSWLLTTGQKLVFVFVNVFHAMLWQFNANLSSPKPGHTTGRSHWGARRGGGAGSGTTVCQQNCAPREQSFLALFKASKTRRLNVSPEAQTSEILCKPMEEQNPRFTIGSSPVYQRFITGTRRALCSWLLTSGTTPFCLCKPFSCRACPGKKPNKMYTKHSPPVESKTRTSTGRGGAGRGGAGRGGAELASLGSTRRARRLHSWHLCLPKPKAIH